MTVHGGQAKISLAQNCWYLRGSEFSTRSCKCQPTRVCELTIVQGQRSRERIKGGHEALDALDALEPMEPLQPMEPMDPMKPLDPLEPRDRMAIAMKPMELVEPMFGSDEATRATGGATSRPFACVGEVERCIKGDQGPVLQITPNTSLW
jgi:hypothetical protein